MVRGQLWRLANPALARETKAAMTKRLMQARREIRAARRAGDALAEAQARSAVDQAKHDLGERGPAWWTDGAMDLNHRMVRNSPTPNGSRVWNKPAKRTVRATASRARPCHGQYHGSGHAR